MRRATAQQSLCHQKRAAVQCGNRWLTCWCICNLVAVPKKPRSLRTPSACPWLSLKRTICADGEVNMRTGPQALMAVTLGLPCVEMQCSTCRVQAFLPEQRTSQHRISHAPLRQRASRSSWTIALSRVLYHIPTRSSCLSSTCRHALHWQHACTPSTVSNRINHKQCMLAYRATVLPPDC